ncbi:MAG TPA: hypothetical protein VFQ36_15000 [Ktedonobacteraceae bacterium]|nr:hypothetical protein [Ktedonobacteraceae bacterium]
MIKSKRAYFGILKRKKVSVSLSIALVIATVILLMAGHMRALTIGGPSSTGTGKNSGGAAFLQGSTPGSMLTGAVATANGKSTQQPTSTISASLANITVDFGNRQNTAYPIPYRYLGIAGIDIGTVLPTNANAVQQANFHLFKLGDYDAIAQIFPTAASLTNPSQQVWTKFDNQMTLATQFNLQPIISLASTPTWLEPQTQSPPQTNACLANNPPFDDHSSKPMYLVNGQDQGPQMWAKLAALVVAHVDQKFPQAHAFYEIWNQPDGSQFLCELPNDQNADQDRVTAYRAIYSAAAPLMKQQAARDGKSTEIGGPALVYALKQHLTMWLPALLNDPTIYPYVDFITYHRFLSSPSFNNGSTSLVANLQDPALGVAAQYEEIAKMVHSGKQPNAASTPIYLDEYAMTPCYPNVCRNDPTTSPLMNALFIADSLNAVYDKNSAYGPAGAVPAGLAYYTWTIPNGNLCMFGVFDAQMDCGGPPTPVQPYPEYYAYNLFGSAQYLDMTDNGHVANTTLIKPTGVYVTGITSKAHDGLAIINTSAQTLTGLHIYLQNPGTVSATQASIFTLKFTFSNPGNSITTSQATLIPVTGGNGYIATINVPANTIVGVSVAAK